jgi:hypothetical protein
VFHLCHSLHQCSLAVTEKHRQALIRDFSGTRTKITFGTVISTAVRRKNSLSRRKLSQKPKSKFYCYVVAKALLRL